MQSSVSAAVLNRAIGTRTVQLQYPNRSKTEACKSVPITFRFFMHFQGLYLLTVLD